MLYYITAGTPPNLNCDSQSPHDKLNSFIHSYVHVNNSHSIDKGSSGRTTTLARPATRAQQHVGKGKLTLQPVQNYVESASIHRYKRRAALSRQADLMKRIARGLSSTKVTRFAKRLQPCKS